MGSLWTKKVRTRVRLLAARVIRGGYGHVALHDTIHGARIEGWAWDPRAFPPAVVVQADGSTVSQLSPLELRSDLAEAGVPPEARSFSVPIHELPISASTQALALFLRTHTDRLVPLSGSPIRVDSGRLGELMATAARATPARGAADHLPAFLPMPAPDLRAHACDRAMALAVQLFWLSDRPVEAAVHLRRAMNLAAQQAPTDRDAVLAVFDLLQAALNDAGERLVIEPGFDRPPIQAAGTSAVDRIEVEATAMRAALARARAA